MSNVVPCLQEGNAQLTKRFPNRDHASDGGIGNEAHQRETSSHNPDDTPGVNAEHDDGDGWREIRARDFDKDLKDRDYTMENVVQLWVTRARAGKMPWVRYIIYRSRIWHRKNGFKTQEYKGANAHNEHAHVTSEFNQASDTVTGTNWYLNDLKPKVSTPTKPAPPKPPADQLVVDGKLGPKTIKRWQQVCHHRSVTDRMDEDFIKAIQGFLKIRVDHRIAVDGGWGPQTTGGLQRWLKCPVTRVMDTETVKSLQRRLNRGVF